MGTPTIPADITTDADMVVDVARYHEHDDPNGATIISLPDGREVVINRYRMWKEAGITVAHSSKIFTGQRLPSLVAAIRISQHLGISIEDLYWIIKHRAAYLATHPRPVVTTK